MHLMPLSPTTGYQRNRLNGAVKNVTGSDVKPALKRWHYAVEVDFPPATETPKPFKRSGLSRGNGVYCSMPSKQYLAAAHPTGGHVTLLEHHRVLLGAVVDQHVLTYLTKLLGCCQQCHCSGGCTWHPNIYGGTGSYMSSEEAGQSRSCNAWDSCCERLRRRLRNCPQIRISQRKVTIYIVDGGGEQHSS